MNASSDGSSDTNQKLLDSTSPPIASSPIASSSTASSEKQPPPLQIPADTKLDYVTPSDGLENIDAKALDLETELANSPTSDSAVEWDSILDNFDEGQLLADSPTTSYTNSPYSTYINLENIQERYSSSPEEPAQKLYQSDQFHIDWKNNLGPGVDQLLATTSGRKLRPTSLPLSPRSRKLPSPLLSPVPPGVDEPDAVAEVEDLLPTTILQCEGSPTVPRTQIIPVKTSFWKYRLQPKGPQGRLFKIDVQSPQDPHEPIEFRDPVFDENLPPDLSHFGKARVGEGNDITPNPEKLAALGKTIRETTKRINMLDDGQSVEKTKLTSSHGRMRKSANHEANKIIFDGVEREREELSNTVTRVQETIDQHSSDTTQCLLEKVQMVIADTYKTKVAGQAGEYIDKILSLNGYISE